MYVHTHTYLPLSYSYVEAILLSVQVERVSLLNRVGSSACSLGKGLEDLKIPFCPNSTGLNAPWGQRLCKCSLSSNKPELLFPDWLVPLAFHESHSWAAVMLLCASSLAKNGFLSLVMNSALLRPHPSVSQPGMAAY